jgi:hypothetical protein
MESYGKRKDGLKVEGYQQVIGMLKTAGRPVLRRHSPTAVPLCNFNTWHSVREAVLCLCVGSGHAALRARHASRALVEGAGSGAAALREGCREGPPAGDCHEWSAPPEP